jgi:hypothetical protein
MNELHILRPIQPETDDEKKIGDVRGLAVK